MPEPPGIYWIQGLGDGGWRNLQRCADHDDAIARMGPLLADPRFRETRLVLARSQDGRIDYTTLVETRDGAVVSNDRLLDAGAPPSARPRPVTARLKPTVLVLAGVLVAAIAGGIAIANYNQPLAIAFFERATAFMRPDRPLPAAPVAKVEEASYAARLFAAVDADDAAETRRLMAARPGDLRLDELRDVVDDGWGAGARAIVDYALLGGHLASADALLSAGAAPSDWLRGVIARNAGLAKLRPAIALLMEFGALPAIAVEAALEETNRELRGDR